LFPQSSKDPAFIPTLLGFLGGKFLVKNNTNTKQNSTTAIIETGTKSGCSMLMRFPSEWLFSVRLIPEYSFILLILTASKKLM
jgi:hypothetical protein